MLLSYVGYFCWDCFCFRSYPFLLLSFTFWLSAARNCPWPKLPVLFLNYTKLSSSSFKCCNATGLDVFFFSLSRVCWISWCGTHYPTCSHCERQLKIAIFSSISLLSWCSYSSRRLCCIAINSCLGSYSAMTGIQSLNLSAGHSFALRHSLLDYFNKISLNSYPTKCAIQAEICQLRFKTHSGVTKVKVTQLVVQLK